MDSVHRKNAPLVMAAWVSADV